MWKELIEFLKIDKIEPKGANLPECTVEPKISCVHFGGALCREGESCGIVKEFRINPKEHKVVDYKLHEEI